MVLLFLLVALLVILPGIAAVCLANRLAVLAPATNFWVRTFGAALAGGSLPVIFISAMLMISADPVGTWFLWLLYLGVIISVAIGMPMAIFAPGNRRKVPTDEDSGH